MIRARTLKAGEDSNHARQIPRFDILLVRGHGLRHYAAMELEILQLLESNRGVPFSVKEVGKKLDRKAWEEEPFWAKHPLERLVSSGQIEKTPEGFYMAPKEKR